MHGTTELSLRHYDPRRFGWATPDYIKNKAIEDYEWMFRVHPPGHERHASRPVWASSLHDTLVNKRAMHGMAYGWEQPKWFVPDDQPLEDKDGWRRPGWYGAARAESNAIRNAVGVMDLSAFSKYEFAGSDAGAFADYLCTGNVPRPGRVSLNYVLTPQGRIETEVTLSCLEDDLLYVISGPMGQQRDLDYFNQNTVGPDGTPFDVSITDVTRDRGVLVVAGPNARELLTRASGMDMSNEAFKFLSVQNITIAGHEMRALRVGFTGSRGWELHAPMDALPDIYNELWAASAGRDGESDLGLADIGSHALNSLRMEKAYLTRFELTHDIGPLQAGVGRWVKPDKGPFIGRDALGDEPVGEDWKLAYIQVDVEDAPGAADCIGGEAVYRDGTPTGLVTSGGYGFTIEMSLAFAYIKAADAEPGTALTINILNEHVPATVLDGPAWDPTNENLLG